MCATVLMTDRAWPDDLVEREVIERAGHTLVCGPADPAPEAEIDALVRTHRPDAILTCWARVSDAAISGADNLRIVARMGVGLDNIAVDAATRSGVRVTNVPDYCVPEVSDSAVGFVLAWTRGIVHFDRDVRQGNWNPGSAKLRRLADLTCGIVGYGRIGRLTAAKLRAFGCTVVAHGRSFKGEAGVEAVFLNELLSRSDVVILHTPLTPETHHLIGKDQLALMKPGSFLVNVSRGAVVDQDAALDALNSGHLGGVGFDVLETEPEVPSALREHPAAIITPHVAFSSDASLIEMRRRAAEEVVRVLAGQAPENPCN
ncbi:phosphoglycerate dehydrogenase [Oceanicola sp. 22II-s10i]|uniref:C-terminal binding protein n=1 Tax=Oceanicola sp. 22II-s10i TaxID=1317116 RepID=UPI000B527DC5|nr:C-terminal binding protein [Oceanicola sp. 22II-s10i]OWU83027.1 phosphoglycerate dehydrogenase [Oceanicola sp. 22II-s10i]